MSRDAISRCSAARRGASLVEVMIAVAIGGMVAAGVSALAVREADGRATRQEDLQLQQAMAGTLSRFSQDVRAGSGLVSADASGFRVRHAHRDGSYSYVCYRLAGERLQRGTATTRTAEPTAWTDFFDAERYAVKAGQFTYFTLGNGVGGQTTTMRRIAIAGLDLRAKRSDLPVLTPVISAVMREASNARDLVSSCEPEVNGHCNGANEWESGSAHVTLCATNRSDRAITLDAFAGDWDSGTAPDPIESIKLDGGAVLWGQGQDEYLKNGQPETFRSSVTIAAGASKRFVLHFHALSGPVHAIALKLFEATDTGRTNPYLITARLD